MTNVADAARNFLRDGKLNEAIEALAVAMGVPPGNIITPKRRRF